jgi:hypothetical protein
MKEIKDIKPLYDRDTVGLEIINAEDFRGSMLARVLNLGSLNERLAHGVGHYRKSVDIPTASGIETTYETVPIMQITPTSDEDELHTRLAMLEFMEKNSRRKFAKPSRYATAIPDTPEHNMEFFNKYLREKPNISEYTPLVILNTEFSKVKHRGCERLEDFRQQLGRVDEMLALEHEVQKHVLEVCSNAGEYVGLATVTIGTNKLYMGKYDEHVERVISVTSNLGVGITHTSKLFQMPRYELPSWVSKVAPKRWASRYVSGVNKIRREEFYGDTLISDINTHNIDKHIRDIITNLIDHNNGETIEGWDDTINQTVKRPNPLIAKRVHRYSVLSQFDRTHGTYQLKKLQQTGRAIKFSVMYHIHPDRVELTFNGFIAKTTREVSNIKQTYGHLLGDRVMSKFEEFRDDMVRIGDRHISEIGMRLIGLFTHPVGHDSRAMIVDRGSRISGDVFNKHIPSLQDYEPVKERIAKLSEWRSYIFENINYLNGYAMIHDHFKPYYGSYNITLPDLVRDGKKALTFENLLPVHLIDQENVSTGKKHTFENLKAITSLDSYGANLVVLTGQNAGGKSVALETIVNTTWLAHCGVPIFGTSFKFNVRQSMGMCFLSRGKGSTMQLQSQKITNILRAFRDIDDPDKCLAIIDELGTGTTQENSIYDPSGGYGFGIKILSACKDYDTIISTQITSLAEFAEEEFDAISYKFDNDHNISMGIGKPDLNKLIKDTGLDEFIF